MFGFASIRSESDVTGATKHTKVMESTPTLLFMTIASRNWAIWVRFPDFCPFERQMCPQYFWMPLNYLQHVCTLYLVPIWRLWMGIEGMDGLLLLFTTIASRDWAIWVRFPDFCPFDRQTCPQYFWMPLKYLQHVCTLYLVPIWRRFGWVLKEWMAFSSFSRPSQAAIGRGFFPVW